MKINRLHILVVTALVLNLFLINTVNAGRKDSANVRIKAYRGSGFFKGSINFASKSPDGVQEIGCRSLGNSNNIAQ